MNNEICAKVVGNKIVIELPIDILVESQKLRPEFPYDILDVNEMAQYIAEYITDFGGDEETGSTELDLLIDKLFDDAYEWGEDWLESSDFEVD